ncbi:wall-associated kinase 2 [Prunus dulcis]|uniref:Wall-associated kinase 2 n=1 Tax=Prunus dulcis TaxID=3755 RepID=A0A4Y1RAJ4_PRUDU|nr:wall-associated kinase 2 [Prunus dulcis]
MGLVVLAAAEAQALPGCPNQCGNLSIPFPFGIAKGCYLRDEFFIDCNETNQTPTPYLNGTGIPISNLSLNGELQIMQFVARDCYDQDGSLDTKLSNTPRLKLFPPYTISGTKNKFIAVGCDTYAIFEGVRGKEKYITGCMTFCESLGSISESCSGIGCCQTSIPSGLQVRTVTMSSYYNHTFIWDFNPCSYSFIVEEGQFTFSSKSFQELKSISRLPMVLNWAIGDEPCDAAQHRQDYACKGNSTCVNPLNLSGYFCECLPGYEGNPYLPDGCQDTDECQISNPCSAGASWTYWGTKKKRFIKLKEKYFQENGGFLLQQQLASRGGPVETTKIFTAEELEKATNNYHESRVLGEGGYGTVYKGILEDDKVVAIKKSKICAPLRMSNLLTRNVVRLLGCCLETPMPLLVYEFIINRTLSEHIHNKCRESLLSWELRLKIAAETAGALAYLHSSISIPIIHRDVKTTNVLLDENYIAKVSDFGASRLIPLDQAQITTLVQGTLGYLDPEYFHSNQLTEKSDLYSFGVVLAELLTSKVALSFARPEAERNLASFFVCSVEQGRLNQILDEDIVNEGNIETLKKVADLANRCLRVKREERPTMKHVAMELEGMMIMAKHPWGKANFGPEDTEYLLGSASMASVRGDNCSSTGTTTDATTVRHNGR